MGAAKRKAGREGAGAANGKKKRKSERSASEEAPKGLEIYWKFSSVDAGVREAAAVALAKELREAQQRYEASGAVANGAQTILLGEQKNDSLLSCAPELQYALPRLVRGLASSNQCARQGFALALTIVATTEPLVTGEMLLRLVDNEIEVSSCMKSQEIKDGLLGRLFAYAVTIRANRFLCDGSKNEDRQLVQKITEELLKLASKKTFLREAATCTLIELLDRISLSCFQESVCTSDLFNEWLKEGPEAGGADVLYLALFVWRKFLSSNFRCPLLPASGSRYDLFQEAHLQVLVPYLKEASISHPKVHQVWNELADILSDNAVFANSGRKSKSKRKGEQAQDYTIDRPLISFWTIVVDETLIVSSHERKHLAMRLVLLFLSKLPTSRIPILISNPFGRCLLDALSSPQNYLYNAAKQFLTDLISWAEQDQDRLVPVIACLQHISGGKFDRLTKTSTIKTLTAAATSESSCLSAIRNVRDMFINDLSTSVDETEEVHASRKIWMLDLLCSFCKLPSASKSASKEVLQFLSAHLLMHFPSINQAKMKKLLKWSPKPIPKAVEEACLVKLRSLLTCKPQTPEDDLAYHLIDFFRDSQKPFVPSDENGEEEDIQAALYTAISQLSSAMTEKQDGDAMKRLLAMRHLLSQLVIQSWLEPDSGDGVALDLIICCNKVFEMVNVTLQTPVEDSDSEPPAIDVLVDALLSLQYHSPAPVRHATEQVFSAFSRDVSASALSTMLKIITKQLGTSEGKQIFQFEGDDDDDDEDVVRVEDVSDGDGEDKSDISSDDAGRMADSEELKEETDEEDMDGEAESDLDDEAMFRIDAHLAGIVKRRKKGSEDASVQLLEVKFRVLGLLENLFSKQPSTPLLVTAVPQLFQAHLDADAGGSKQLADRIRLILNKVFKEKLYPRGPDVDPALVDDLLQKLMRALYRETYDKVQNVGQALLFWLVKIRRAVSEEKTAAEVFLSALEEIFNSKKCRLGPKFISESLLRFPWLGVHLLGKLIQKCTEARDEHLKAEAMNILGNYLRQSAAPSSTSRSECVEALQGCASLLSDTLLRYLEEPLKKTERQKSFLRCCVACLEALSSAGKLSDVIDCGALLAALATFKPSAKANCKEIIDRIESLLRV